MMKRLARTAPVLALALVLAGCELLGWYEGGSATAAPSEEEAYVLFAPLRQTNVYLIDLDGDVVHEWELSGKPGNSVYLVEGGYLLATYGVPNAFRADGSAGGVELLNWEGDQIWSFELATDDANLHHDVDMMPNGNVLMIAWEKKSRTEALQAGISSSQLPASGEVWPTMILEYNPALDAIVWEWHLWDHTLPAGWSADEHPEKIDLAYATKMGMEDLFHCNSIDYNASLDQIVISSMASSEIWIIDHGLTTIEAAGPAGDLLYRYGNSQAYGGTGSQQFYGQHDAEWLESGNVLLFDNGGPRVRSYSRVVELGLPDYGSGAFEDASIVWQYGAASGDEHFFSHRISGAQRLESGNTLICEGDTGRFFEVTPSGSIVWEYVSPYTVSNRDGTTSSAVFRCERYETDSPELAGTELGT